MCASKNGVAAREIERRGMGGVEHQRHREVWFTAENPDPRLLDLRTVDDLFLVVAVIDGVGHTKADLELFAEPARRAPVEELLRVRRLCGVPATASGVDVAASFLGRRNYSRFDIEDVVGQRVAAGLGLPYHSRRDGTAPPEGGISLRVTVEGAEAVLAMRVAGRPMHRRPYKQASSRGTLHPPLAAALAGLAGLAPGMRVLDPCCGTGTILIEACDSHDAGRMLGSDLDAGTLASAAANAMGTPGSDAITWAVADAGRLPVADGTIDRVISNPPWGRQVEAHGALAGRPQHFYTELRRVLSPRGQSVLLLHEAEEHLSLAKAAGFEVRGNVPVSLFGAHPSVVTLAV